MAQQKKKEERIQFVLSYIRMKEKRKLRLRQFLFSFLILYVGEDVRDTVEDWMASQ